MKRSDGGPPYRKEADDGRELETDHDHVYVFNRELRFGGGDVLLDFVV